MINFLGQIVRDYVVSRNSGNDLLQLQRKCLARNSPKQSAPTAHTLFFFRGSSVAFRPVGVFVEQILRSRESWEEQPSSEVVRGHEIEWFASHALQVRR